MERNYNYMEIDMRELLLDDENPRFASSILVKKNNNEISQETIIKHLLTYADVWDIAKRINNTGELHGADMVTCYKRGDGKYIVIEGNRRVCACKLLLDRALIPEGYKKQFPFITDRTKQNISRITIAVYPDRKSVQAYLSDRHITGVKKWSALEKNNYYMNLFNTYGNVNKVKEHTSDTLGVVKKSIKKYQFFMNVFNVLKTKHDTIEIEKLNYLPMVDRFMETLAGNDEEVGLNLEFDEKTLTYSCIEDKVGIYKDILMLVGEAFLIRKEKRFCAENEMCRIISNEISGFPNQKKLITDNIRIPGLIDLINQYKNGAIKNDVSSTSNTTQHDDNYDINKDDNLNKNDESDIKSDSGSKNSADKSNALEDEKEKTEDSEREDGVEREKDAEVSENEDVVYTPPVKYTPKKTKIEYLCFNQDEAKNFSINTSNDFDVKIRHILFDLSKFSVYKHPYTVALLYRTLLEISTKKVYFVVKDKIGQEYNEKSLVVNMRHITNNFLFNGKKEKDESKIKEAIKNNLNSINLIDVLNLYIHYENPVDENIIVSSWNSMKKYVQYCLEV